MPEITGGRTEIGGPITVLTGDAATTDVKSGKTFYNVDPSIKETGTLSTDVIHDDEDSRYSTTSGIEDCEYHLVDATPPGYTVYKNFNLACSQATVIYAMAAGAFNAQNASTMSIALFIDGVEVSDSLQFKSTSESMDIFYAMGHRAVAAGSRSVEAKLHSTAGADVDNTKCCMALFGGCGKI